MEFKRFDRIIKREELKSILRQKIIDGNFRPGDRFPSENEMSRDFGLCRNTIREAIASLVHEGLLKKSQGRGTFVSERKTGPLTIALVTSQIWHEGHTISSRLLSPAEEAAHEHNARILLYLDHGSIDRERENLLDLLDRRVDGLILFYIGGETNLDCLDKIHRSGIPTVMVDRYLEDSKFDYVVSDNYTGAYQVVETLFRQGFRKIYFLANCSIENVSSINDRLKGYISAISNNNLDSYIIDCAANHSSFSQWENSARIYSSVCEIADREIEPFAIFVLTMSMLDPAMMAIAERSLPHDRFALACFDDPLIRWPDDITLVRAIQPMEEIGKRSVGIIMNKLNGRCDLQQIHLPVEIHTCY